MSLDKWVQERSQCEIGVSEWATIFFLCISDHGLEWDLVRLSIANILNGMILSKIGSARGWCCPATKQERQEGRGCHGCLYQEDCVGSGDSKTVILPSPPLACTLLWHQTWAQLLLSMLAVKKDVHIHPLVFKSPGILTAKSSHTCVCCLFFPLPPTASKNMGCFICNFSNPGEKLTVAILMISFLWHLCLSLEQLY